MIACDAIAAKLSSRPRKRAGVKTPEGRYVQTRRERASEAQVLQFKLELRSAMYRPGRRERQRKKCCSSNLNSGSTFQVDVDLATRGHDEAVPLEETQRSVLPERV